MHGGPALINLPVVVFGVVGNDIHVVANRILHLCLEAKGFRPVNLGTNNRPENFADAALECAAEAVLVSSLNGEAMHWCRSFQGLFAERGIADTIIYLGGNLATGDRPAAEVERSFLAAGIDRAYHGVADFDAVLATLHEDIARGRATS